MTIATVITRAAVRRSPRTRAAFAAECLLHATSLLVLGGMSALLWGFGPERSVEQLGLVGRRERVVALGGSLDAGPAPGGGRRVRAEVPHAPSAPVPGAAELG